MSDRNEALIQAANEESDDLQPPYVGAAIAGVLVFALYAITLAPTTAFWDTSEYIATAEIMGIPHPPGNPLFVVLAKAWSLVLAPLGLSVAVRVNLFSALMSASAHALWFLVVHHVLRHFSSDRFFRLAGASAAVLVSATAFTVWSQSNVNEKVYTVSLLTIALLSWLTFRWQENLGKGKDDNLLVLMAFILALSVGNHLMAFLAAPAIGLFILYVRPQTLLNWKLYVAGLGAAIVGLTIHLMLPIRAGLGPLINEAAPTCPDGHLSSLVAVISYGQAGCEALADALNRTQYNKPPLIPRQAPLDAQVVNYLQYFDWQWARSLDGVQTVFARMRLPFTMLFTGLGVWGAIEHMRRDRSSFIYFVTLFGTLSAALIFYLNFKYGYGLQAPVADRSLHEVRDRDYFFIVSFSVWGLWAGMGIATLWREAVREAKQKLNGMSPKLMMSPILGLAFIPLILNWSWATRTYDYSARDWAYNLLMSVEPYGILFTNGDNDTFPLWYLQEAEGIRQDVTVIVTSYLNTDWYALQLKQLTRPCAEGEDPFEDPSLILCQRPYTWENTQAAYVTPGEDPGDRVPIVVDEIRAPTRSIFALDDAQIREAAMQGFVAVDEGLSIPIGNVQARVQAGQYLAPWQRFALALMIESIDERPIYFASSGNAAVGLGLYPYLVRHGVAFKVNDGLPLHEPENGLTRLESSPYQAATGQWIDTDRTGLLADEVFIHRGGIPEQWSHWPDISTIGIPNYYAWTYLSLLQAADQSGDPRAEHYAERSENWSSLGSG
jgi:hypothetical protein